MEAPTFPGLWDVLPVLQTLHGGQDLAHHEFCAAPRGEFSKVCGSRSASVTDLLPQGRGGAGGYFFLSVILIINRNAEGSVAVATLPVTILELVDVKLTIFAHVM